MADSSPLAHSPTLAGPTARLSGEDDEHLAAGTAVGDYVIERFLGAGAMGEVYAGSHPIIGKRVAIKILRLELAASAEAAERFIREARAVNQIDHENVVDVFAFGRLDDGRLYLVMDLVDGRSLRRGPADGPLPFGTGLEILEGRVSALDAAHKRGVVHRDLKPDNIMLSNATPAKVMILDFGIAKLISTANEGKPTGPGTLTGAGTWLGTPGYMAPEQWSVDGAGPASDRYALGVIAFELLTGTPPFSASSVPAMMEQHFRAKVPALSTRGTVLPSAVDTVLAKALAKDPDARYATARELVEALRTAAGPDAAKARGAVAAPGGPRKMWVPAIAGVGLLGGAFAVVVMSRSDDKPKASPSERSNTEVPKGSVAIEVVSTPASAEVKKGSMLVGKTPVQVAAQPSETLEIDVRKAGYLPEHRSINVAEGERAVAVNLVAVQQFEGTWQLSSGELRAFARRNDEVDVFKLAAVDGERVFMKTYQFSLVDSGVEFGGEESVSDPRAPNEPSCNVRLSVAYHYDPVSDVLEQEREKVSLDFAAGKCIVQARKTEPSALARVGAANEAHDLSAPVGTLSKGDLKAVNTPLKKKSTKTVLPFDPKAELEKKKALEQAVQQKKSATPPIKKPSPGKQGKLGSLDFGSGANSAENQMSAPNVAKQTTDTYTSGTKSPKASTQNESSPPQQVMPQPQPGSPQAVEPPAQQAPVQQKSQIQKK